MCTAIDHTGSAVLEIAEPLKTSNLDDQQLQAEFEAIMTAAWPCPPLNVVATLLADGGDPVTDPGYSWRGEFRQVSSEPRRRGTSDRSRQRSPPAGVDQTRGHLRQSATNE